MAGFCTLPTDASLVRGLLTSVDCNVQTMSEIGYRTISGPNSQVGLALTALMTIYVAVLGLRLLLGLSPLRIGEVTLTALKLAVVLALATSWPTYQTLVFDTLFHGPEQLAGSIMTAIQPDGSVLRGNPFDALQVAFDQLQAAATYFARMGSPTVSPLTGGASFAALAMNISSYLLMMTTIGVVLTAKIVLGILLALGPVFVALFLFESTRGVFEGWLRAALALAFAPLFATLALVVQLVLIEPQLIAIARMLRPDGQPNYAAASAVLLLTLIGSAVCLAGLIGMGVTAAGLRLPRRGTALAGLNMATLAERPAAAFAGDAAQPRAVAVAAAAMAMERRDNRMIDSSPRRFSFGPQAATATAQAPLGQVYRSAARPRRDAASERRDR